MFGRGRMVYATYCLEDAAVRACVLQAWAERLRQNPDDAEEWNLLYADAIGRLDLG